MHLVQHHVKVLFTFWANAWSINETIEAFRQDDWFSFLATLIFAISLAGLSIFSANK